MADVDEALWGQYNMKLGLAWTDQGFEWSLEDWDSEITSLGIILSLYCGSRLSH